MIKRTTYLIAIIALGISHSTMAWQAKEVTSGLNVPWGMSYFDDEKLLVTQRNGELGIVDLKTGNFSALPSVSQAKVTGQGGLLDVAQSPFKAKQFYFTYSKQVNDAVETTLAVADLTASGMENWRELLVTQSGSDGGRHFGSRITFDEQFVYFSVGDRGERDNGQNLSTHAGSIIRLHPDGRVPQDNPFVNKDNAQAEIWSYGHRNPQGLFFDHTSSRLWSIEHGPRGGDEVNEILKGENYGWPITSHGKEYWGPISVGEAEELPGIQPPKQVYVPSIAPSSLILYRGGQYPELDGKLVAGALKLTHLNILTLDKQGNVIKEQRILESLGERIRDIETTPEGVLYFSTDSGKIFRLER